jgi:hypothetical protein
MAALNAVMAAVVDGLAAEGVPDALAQPLTLAAVWADLARLAGEELPAWVGARLEAPAANLSASGVERLPSGTTPMTGELLPVASRPGAQGPAYLRRESRSAG